MLQRPVPVTTSIWLLIADDQGPLDGDALAAAEAVVDMACRRYRFWIHTQEIMSWSNVWLMC
jgi:hypothetical protein